MGLSGEIARAKTEYIKNHNREPEYVCVNLSGYEKLQYEPISTPYGVPSRIFSLILLPVNCLEKEFELYEKQDLEKALYKYADNPSPILTVMRLRLDNQAKEVANARHVGPMQRYEAVYIQDEVVRAYREHIELTK